MKVRECEKASEATTRDFSKSKRIFWPTCQNASELAQPVYGEARRTLRSPNKPVGSEPTLM
jgi:hypothetical protein